MYRTQKCRQWRARRKVKAFKRAKLLAKLYQVTVSTAISRFGLFKKPAPMSSSKFNEQMHQHSG